MTEDKKVLCDINNQVALVRLNKPARRNALCTRLLSELEQTFQQLADDDDVRVIVLAGNGAGFCAGADLNDTKGFVSGERGIEDPPIWKSSISRSPLSPVCRAAPQAEAWP